MAFAFCQAERCYAHLQLGETQPSCSLLLSVQYKLPKNLNADRISLLDMGSSIFESSSTAPCDYPSTFTCSFAFRPTLTVEHACAADAHFTKPLCQLPTSPLLSRFHCSLHPSATAVAAIIARPSGCSEPVVAIHDLELHLHFISSRGSSKLHPKPGCSARQFVSSSATSWCRTVLSWAASARPSNNSWHTCHARTEPISETRILRAIEVLCLGPHLQPFTFHSLNLA